MDEFLKKLADQGVIRHADTIRNIELGHTQPSDKLLNAMARVFDARRETLLLRPAPRTSSADRKPEQ
ncbi:hypothetical protein NE236_41595 [Actinoallomurus purpureus]|uniref:hypothetical protein n=1 Tax=Actinoallomurus purpureus TaxID=478114 RepID=UPI002093B0B3|nr:hypothetical protein [Actinoallomurus purpureus]MCO6011464.1 hypothetical protein [Actinoallomurus purpureus]